MSPPGKNTKSCWSWPFAASQSGAPGGLRWFWLAVSSKQELRDLSASDSRRNSHCSVRMHIHACMQLIFVSVSQQAVQHHVGPLLTAEIKSQKQKRRGEIIQQFKKSAPFIQSNTYTHTHTSLSCLKMKIFIQSLTSLCFFPIWKLLCVSSLGHIYVLWWRYS